MAIDNSPIHEAPDKNARWLMLLILGIGLLMLSGAIQLGALGVIGFILVVLSGPLSIIRFLLMFDRRYSWIAPWLRRSEWTVPVYSIMMQPVVPIGPRNVRAKGRFYPVIPHVGERLRVDGYWRSGAVVMISAESLDTGTRYSLSQKK